MIGVEDRKRCICFSNVYQILSSTAHPSRYACKLCHLHPKKANEAGMELVVWLPGNSSQLGA